MKLKAGLDSAALKQFFVNHGEKLGLAVGILLAGYTVMCAYEIQPYNKTAKDLESHVTAARGNLNSSEKRLDLTKAGIVLPSKSGGFAPQIQRELISPLNPAKFAGIEWNRPLFETKQRRLEPTYLAVRDLRVEYRYAAVELKGGSADMPSHPIGEEWIAVTGLIPIEDQATAYYRAFQSSGDQVTNAKPLYPSYEIRRAEVKDASEKVDWEKIVPLKYDTAVTLVTSSWQGVGPEMPAKELTLPVLTEPLPPLSNVAEYGQWCSHPGLDLNAVPAVGDAPNAGAGGVLGAPIAPGLQPPVVAQNPNAVEKSSPKNLLFRFLDFDVQSGKQYRYQVRLVIKNPNFQLDPAHLEKPELGEGETRLAPWSAPSPSAAVPHLQWFFAGGLKGTGVGGDNEPEVTMGVKQWSSPNASVIMAKFTDMLRGSRLDSASTEIQFMAPVGTGVLKQTTAFKSGSLLLDFAWERTENRLSGPPNDRKVNRPSETLVLNPRGELVICAQTMDQRLWDDVGSVGVGGVGPRGGGSGGQGGAMAAAVQPPDAAPSTTTPVAVPPTAPTPAATAVPTATPSGTAPKLQLKLN